MTNLSAPELTSELPVDRARRIVDDFFPGGIGIWASGRMHLGSGTAIDLIEPSTGASIVSWADPGVEGAELAIETARNGAIVWGATAPFERARILRNVSAAIEAQAEKLAQLESATTGKPIRDTRGEVLKVVEMFAFYAGWADKIRGETIPVPGDWLTYTQKVPWGIVVAITPWNAPLFTAGWNSAPALAAGNAVILKPSEVTPLTSLALGRIAEEAGLPAGVLTIASGLGSTLGAALTADRRVGKISFIGSVPTGRRVAQAAAAAGTPVLLELGGKSANVVFEDADLTAAAHGAISAIFSGAGQSCVAGSRLLVQRSVRAELIERVAALAAGLRMGDPFDPSTEVGPIISAAQLPTINHLITTGIAEGAQLLSSPRAHLTSGALAGGHWVLPTILDGVTAGSTLETNEVFGPVVGADAFDTEDEVVARANATDFGLAGAVWTSDVSRAHRVASRINAGTFWINGYKSIHVAVPFGGFGDSGWGRSSGPGVIDEYTQTKAVWVPTAASGPSFPSMSY